MAAALAILADRIDYRIFAPIYTGARDDGIRELLLRHADTDTIIGYEPITDTDGARLEKDISCNIYCMAMSGLWKNLLPPVYQRD